MRKMRILLGVSGSISAYKAADLTNELTKIGYDVDVLMTQNSQAFITPLTLQSLSKRAVHTDVMSEQNPAFTLNWQSKQIYLSLHQRQPISSPNWQMV